MFLSHGTALSAGVGILQSFHSNIFIYVACCSGQVSFNHSSVLSLLCCFMNVYAPNSGAEIKPFLETLGTNFRVVGQLIIYSGVGILILLKMSF